ncbi:MAG: SH3 domain-containing protein [Bacteroidales bacterium]|nr:SH3 domain-containing protein [Bacteroidales bacterium]
MKKIVIIVSMAAIFISSCSVIENLIPADPTPVPPTPTFMPTATPDPCASENLLEEVEKVQDLVNAFQDVAYVANFTPQTELILPIMEMQAVRRNLQKLDVPECEEAIKTASLNYMNSTINYLSFFMGGETKENVDAGIQNSQVLWQVVLGEFNKLLTSAGLVSEELPDIVSAVPQTTDSNFFVDNDGTQRVNVRSQPNLDADIISQFEPGMQAIGLARNEPGDWLQVNLNGVIGWVNTEMVTTSAAVEELAVYDPDQ